MTDLAATYRRVFQSPDGQAVLDDICLRGGMFNPSSTDEERIRENFAKEIFSLANSDEEGHIKRDSFIDTFKRLKRLILKRRS